MFKILGENPIFHQWDLDQKLIVEDSSVTQVHFTNGSTDSALVCEVYEQDGLKLVDVPNILLQKSLSIMAYAYCTNYTKQSVIFKVIARSKPDSYIYTETEVKTFAQLEDELKAAEDRITALEEKPEPVVDLDYNADSENAQSGKAVAQAVANAGGGEKWEQIADLTLEENAVFNITKDMSGNSFALKNFIVILSKSAVEGNTTKGYPWVKAKTTKQAAYTPFVAVEGGALYADNIKTAWRYEGEIKHAWQTTWRAVQDSADNTIYAYGDYMSKLGIRTEFRKDNTPLTAFQFTWGYSGVLPVGTRVEIWGVRA